MLKYVQWNQSLVEGAELNGGDTPLQLLYHPLEASEFKAGSLNQFTAFTGPLILLPPICLLGILLRLELFLFRRTHKDINSKQASISTQAYRGSFNPNCYTALHNEA